MNVGFTNHNAQEPWPLSGHLLEEIENVNSYTMESFIGQPSMGTESSPLMRRGPELYQQASLLGFNYQNSHQSSSPASRSIPTSLCGEKELSGKYGNIR